MLSEDILEQAPPPADEPEPEPEPVPEPEEEPNEPESAPEPEDEDELEAEEAPLRSAVHPAAAATFTAEDVTPDKGQYFIGLWHGKDNFGCPYCSFSSIEGNSTVELHILSKIDSGDIAHRAYEGG